MRETLSAMMANAADVMPRAKPRLVANNTVQYMRANGDMVWRLHHTDIAVKHANGSFTLDAGGWRTVTTKDRLNRFTPVCISQHKGIWYVGADNVPFTDGMRVDRDGQPIGDTAKAVCANQQAIALRKRINAFVRTVDDCVTLPLPNSGDCWFCSMFDRNHIMPNSNVDHLLSHMDESYLHGSLIANAMRWAGFTDASIGLHIQMNFRDTVKRTLRRYLSRRLGLAS